MGKKWQAADRAQMPEARQLLFMTQVADSAFPSGGFAFSSGLETLVQEGSIESADDYQELVAEQILTRWFEFDRWFLQRAYQSMEARRGVDVVVHADRLCDVQTLCDPLLQASVRMGRAALTSAHKIGIDSVHDYAEAQRSGRTPGHLPIVQGVIGASVGMPLLAVEVAAVHALLNGALSAGVRMGRIGALVAQRTLLELGDVAAERLQKPCSSLPHAFSPVSEIAATRRDRLDIRLFSA